MATLELRGLNKTYDDGSRVVADLDLRIDDGELFVLVGPSGCGKTTVLRMIAGLEDITSGDVLIDDVVVNDVGTSERDIALAFQSYALYPHMTVAENIGFSLKAAHVHHTTLDARVREVAALLQITDVLDRRPRQLSGGQQQRSALGRAIVREPRLLLLDEPMSNLDTRLRIETRAAICRIQRRLGLTTVCVTHDQVEAMAMGQRIAVMRHGRIVQCGPPLELYRQPVDLFVGQFIGSPSMNVLAATVDDDDDGMVLRIGSQRIPLDDAVLARLPVLRQMLGRKLAVGVRPEGFVLDDDGSLVVSATFTERLGADQLVYATLDAPRVVATDDGVTTIGRGRSTIIVSTTAGVDVSIWKPLTLRVDTTQLYLFDISTGAAIGAVRA